MTLDEKLRSCFHCGGQNIGNRICIRCLCTTVFLTISSLKYVQSTWIGSIVCQILSLYCISHQDASWSSKLFSFPSQQYDVGCNGKYWQFYSQGEVAAGFCEMSSYSWTPGGGIRFSEAPGALLRGKFLNILNQCTFRARQMPTYIVKLYPSVSPVFHPWDQGSNSSPLLLLAHILSFSACWSQSAVIPAHSIPYLQLVLQTTGLKVREGAGFSLASLPCITLGKIFSMPDFLWIF